MSVPYSTEHYLPRYRTHTTWVISRHLPWVQFFSNSVYAEWSKSSLKGSFRCNNGVHFSEFSSRHQTFPLSPISFAVTKQLHSIKDIMSLVCFSRTKYFIIPGLPETIINSVPCCFKIWALFFSSNIVSENYKGKLCYSVILPSFTMCKINQEIKCITEETLTNKMWLKAQLININLSAVICRLKNYCSFWWVWRKPYETVL